MAAALPGTRLAECRAVRAGRAAGEEKCLTIGKGEKAARIKPRARQG